MVKITPENITQDEILKLLEALVMLKEIIDQLKGENIKELNLAQRLALKQYSKRINNIYEEIDNKK